MTPDMPTETRQTVAVLVFSVTALAAGALMHALDAPGDVAWTLGALVPLALLVHEMFDAIRAGRPGVDVIALLAIGGALALGEYLTAAIIGLMLASGQYLDAYAAGRAERELTALVERAPRDAHRREGGTVQTVPLDTVRPGDHLVIKPGEVVPVDGTVTLNAAVLDESALTGEPLPVEHPPGDVVRSGAVNVGGAIELLAVAGAADSTYAGIVRLVQEAQQSRAPVTRLADRWAGWFIPVTLITAALAWVLSGDPVRALAVLVVATPCPLLLAVPIAIVAGVSRAARRGIIFRGGGPLEALARVNHIVVDKTGTLTVGRPTVNAVTVLDGDLTADDGLRLAASVEQFSTHVLAHAIVEEARQRGLPLTLPADAVEEAGGGAAGTVDGRRVEVGKADWVLRGRAEPEAMRTHRRRMMRVAPMSTYVSVDGRVIAAISFNDVIRPDAAAAIRRLRGAGLDRVVLATGDHPEVARSVGLAIGIDEVLAECTPEEKASILRELGADGTTAMVGDGINDAPALAIADVGVAMGARGATASSEAADVVLMVDELQRLVEGIHIARRSRRIAVQSVGIGMGLSLGAMAAATVGWLAPLAGAIAQEFIDVIAIANALRALGDGLGRNGSPQLPPELLQRLRSEHDELIPRLDLLRSAADNLDDLEPAAAHSALQRVQDFLQHEVIPHELADELDIYPEMAARIGGEDPLATMSRSHREIFHLTDVFTRIMDDVSDSGLEPGDVRDVRRVLYSLHAVLRLHFDQEEELYFGLDENYYSISNGARIASEVSSMPQA